MRVLITGGAGFIGSHLAEGCLERGDEVDIIDDLSTGTLRNLKDLQDDLRYRSRLSVHIDTILNYQTMGSLIRKADQVFHLAAAVGVKYILDNPLSSIKTNIQGTEAVLDLCCRFQKPIVTASSSEVYGKHLHAPLVETDNIIYGPSSKFRWSYAASKLMDEFTALAYYRTQGLKVVIARLFNTVGQRQTGAYGMVVPRFVGAALKNKPLFVYGDGTQTRTFTYVKDVVVALLGLMNEPKAYGEVFNVGGVEEISIKDLAEKIIRMTGSTSDIKLVPYEKAYAKDFEDMQRRVPSIDKINRVIRFEPKTDLDTTLGHVIDFIKKCSYCDYH